MLGRWLCSAVFGFAPALVAAEPCAGGGDALLEYRIEPVELADRSAAARLLLHEDGCVEVNEGGWYRDPGRYTFRLPTSELRQLLREFDQDLFGFEPEEAQRAVQNAANERAARARSANMPLTVDEVADGDIGRFRMAFSAEQAGRFRIGQGRAIARELSWRELQHDAEHNPEVAALVGLARAEARLRALMNDPRRVRVTP